MPDLEPPRPARRRRTRKVRKRPILGYFLLFVAFCGFTAAIFWDDVLPYIARFAAVVRPYFYGHAPRAGASSAISAAHSGSAGGGDACPLGFDTPPEDGGAGEQNKCGGFMAEADFAQALTCYNYARRTARNALLQAKAQTDGVVSAASVLTLNLLAAANGAAYALDELGRGGSAVVASYAEDLQLLREVVPSSAAQPQSNGDAQSMAAGIKAECAVARELIGEISPKEGAEVQQEVASSLRWFEEQVG